MAKNVALSLTVPPEVHALLVARASAADLPVRPATLAAHLLAKALTSPAVPVLDLSADDEAYARSEVHDHGMMNAKAAGALLKFYDAVMAQKAGAK